MFYQFQFIARLAAVVVTVSICTEPVFAAERHRVLVSTDIGGTDPDDFQSMVHLLVYADVLEIEGLISSPYGPGRKQHILDVIDCYNKDFKNLKTYSDNYPTSEKLRSLTMQGETEIAPYAGVRESTEGSRWLIERARHDDPRPLHVLVWGGIEDLAQALHDAPDILPKLRVYYIGGPNKKWSPNAYQYIVTHHPQLWIIEANSTYRGWFIGGNQAGEWGNSTFVKQHVRRHGSLGDFFAAQLDSIKMGDTPSVSWLLQEGSDDPSQLGWGGQFVRAWNRPHFRLDRLSTPDDQMEVFGVLELALPLGDNGPQAPVCELIVENQTIPAHFPGDGTVRFRFCPKAVKTYHFKIRSNVSALDGQIGGIRSIAPDTDVAKNPSTDLPHWWTDNPAPHLTDRGHHGAKSVSRWREDYLKDFSERMQRCSSPSTPKTKR